MDTRFWGPDGWKLLHSIAIGYPENPTKVEKDVYSSFFNGLKYVLPCIYCRRSYTQYINELPVEPFLKNRRELSKWLYEIHNKVNAKLRGQGLNPNADPPFEDIYMRYGEYVREINQANCVSMPGWDFIYCILFVFPENKKNIEVARFNHIVPFFYLLQRVVPFEVFKKQLGDYLESHPIIHVMNTREQLKKWGYELEKDASRVIDCNCVKYRDRCDMIEMHRAGCGGKKDIKPTCRINNTKK